MSKFLTIESEEVQPHLGNLPDWYIKVLEERQKNQCDTCPDNWIEIELTDFDGAPISGEPYFVLLEGGNGSAIVDAPPEGGNFTNGAGQTTPKRLTLAPTADIVDVAFGGDTMITTNFTDDKWGIDYEEQLFLVDYPVEYDGVLSFSSDKETLMEQIHAHFLNINDAKEAGVPSTLILDMLEEVDIAAKAKLELYSDISLTARNESEARLLLAMQGIPYSLWTSKIGIEFDHGRPPENAFENGIMGAPISPIFLGPDGGSYLRSKVFVQLDDEDINWISLAGLFDMLESYALSV